MSRAEAAYLCARRSSCVHFPLMLLMATGLRVRGFCNTRRRALQHGKIVLLKVTEESLLSGALAVWHSDPH
jgi:hypothetical protein